MRPPGGCSGQNLWPPCLHYVLPTSQKMVLSQTCGPSPIVQLLGSCQRNVQGAAAPMHVARTQKGLGPHQLAGRLGSNSTLCCWVPTTPCALCSRATCAARSTSNHTLHHTPRLTTNTYNTRQHLQTPKWQLYKHQHTHAIRSSTRATLAAPARKKHRPTAPHPPSPPPKQTQYAPTCCKSALSMLAGERTTAVTHTST